MALITDPDSLNQGTEITFDTTARTVTLDVAGNLSNDGVNWSALYSFKKEEWNEDGALIPTPLPSIAIDNDAGKFAIGQNASEFNDWRFLDDSTRNLLRGGGWQEYNAAGDLRREYICPFSGDGIESTSRAYFFFENDTSKTDFSFDGPVNQGVQTFGDSSNGNFDKRSEVLTIRVRTQGNRYASASSTALPQIATNLKPIFAPLTLVEEPDPKITASDATIDADAPYTGMSITWGAVTRDIGGTSYNYSIVIDGNGGTAEQIYEFIQRQLRRDADIDSGTGTQNGFLAPELLTFIGDNLETSTGVYIDNFNSNDTNRITFTDDTGTGRTFPFVSAGTINFNANLTNDSDAVYRMFFTTNPAGDFGTSNAVLVDDNGGSDISGTVGGNSSISFDFDYDGNTQGGRTAGTDADVTIVAIGLDTAQYVLAEGTITRSTGLNFTLTSALERNYTNQA